MQKVVGYKFKHTAWVRKLFRNSLELLENTINASHTKTCTAKISIIDKNWLTE